MKMTKNEVLARQSVITQILLKNGNDELSKNLKVKLMGMRISLGKIRREFDEDLKEVAEQLQTKEFIALRENQSRTEEEEETFNKMVLKINDEYNSFITEKGKEEIDFDSKKFTEDEYAEILQVNADNDVEINGSKISAPDFLEVVYNLFVL